MAGLLTDGATDEAIDRADLQSVKVRNGEMMGGIGLQHARSL